MHHPERVPADYRENMQIATASNNRQRASRSRTDRARETSKEKEKQKERERKKWGITKGSRACAIARP